MKNVLITIVVIGALILVPKAIMGIIDAQSDNELKGFEYSLEAFNAICVSEATSDGSVTKEVATAYCTCVYDKGVAEYGSKGWTQQMVDYETTETFTPKINEFINQCVTETMGS